jgi:hypothetical protein
MFKCEDKVTAIVYIINRKLKISIKYIYNIELKLHQHYNNIIVDAI